MFKLIVCTLLVCIICEKKGNNSIFTVNCASGLLDLVGKRNPRKQHQPVR